MKRKRILARQERALASKQRRYENPLLELELSRFKALFMSLHAKVLMGEKLNESTACDLKRKELEIRRLRAQLRKYKRQAAQKNLTSRSHISGVSES